jgi:HSP20 family protein
VRLPFNVDSTKVDAHYEKGVLKIALTKAEADKPRKISVRNAE